jgi:hypothetical protein
MMADEHDADNARTEFELAEIAAERPRRRSASRVLQIHNVAGIPDAFAEGADVRELRRGKRPTPDLSDYRGHERVGVANLEDDVDADA